jgi:hypothetical protein
MLWKLKQKIFEWFWLASTRGIKHQLWHIRGLAIKFGGKRYLLQKGIATVLHV